MAKPNRTEVMLLVLAGIGAGTLIGALVGLVVGKRAGRQDQDTIADTVDALKERAERVLGDLSDGVTDLIGRTRDASPDAPPSA